MRSWVEECSFCFGEIERYWRWNRSARTRKVLKDFWHEWQAKSEEEAADLSPSDQLDRALLQWKCRRSLFELSRLDHLSALSGEDDVIAQDIFSLEHDRWCLDRREPEDMANQVSAINRKIKSISAEPEPPYALWAANSLKQAQEALQAWKKSTLGYNPTAQWWLETPVAELERLLDERIKHLKEEAAGQKGESSDPLVGTPVGREAIEEELRCEAVPRTPEGMLEIGRRQAEWCRQQMSACARELGHDDWRDALEAVKKDHVAPGDQERFVYDLCGEAIEWTEKLDLVSLYPLCRNMWNVEMLSEEAQRSLPFLGYGGQKVVVSYPLPGMDHETKQMSMAGNCRAFTRAVVPHELIPGHHLQLFEADRLSPYRRMFETPFHVEGWTIHWELLQLKLGWARTPEEKIGMLWWRLHRCNRIVVSLAFHFGEMTPDEMVEYLVEHGGQERHTARSEVRRFIGTSYPPLYQCAYLIGGLQMHALYRELTEDRGWTPKEAHDRILAENGMPISCLRDRLLGLEMGETLKGWDFEERAVR